MVKLPLIPLLPVVWLVTTASILGAATTASTSCYIGTSRSTTNSLPDHGSFCEAPPSSSIHLISLPSLENRSPKVVNDIWRWKNSVLGDGRDYFVFRPRALRALNNLMVGKSLVVNTMISPEIIEQHGHQNNIQQWTVEECSILSNCARFDCLLVLSRNTTNSINETDPEDVTSCDNHMNKTAIGEAVAFFVASCLFDQLSWHQSQLLSSSSSTISSPSNVAWEGISSFLDLPGRILNTDNTKMKKTVAMAMANDIHNIQTEEQDSISCLASRLDQTNDIEDIIRHFSLIASGIALRPSNPKATINFRPFSSRDAHIMLQLKRTADLASSYPKCKLILDSALSAGKAARDEKKVPAIGKLRGYSTEGRYRMSAPESLSKQAQESVEKKVIEPTVLSGMKKLESLKYSNQITVLREDANMILNQVIDGNDKNRSVAQRLVNRLLHEPMMDIRASKRVNNEKILSLIRSELLKLANEDKLVNKG